MRRVSVRRIAALVCAALLAACCAWLRSAQAGEEPSRAERDEWHRLDLELAQRLRAALPLEPLREADAVQRSGGQRATWPWDPVELGFGGRLRALANSGGHASASISLAVFGGQLVAAEIRVHVSGSISAANWQALLAALGPQREAVPGD